MRYKELKYSGKVYTAKFQIEEILIKEKLNWILDCEIEKTRLEIINNTLIWNAGIFYNGTIKFIVFRAGQIKAGIWENGVFYNGHVSNLKFNNGLIFEGKFFNSHILNGEIRGGVELNNCKISDTVKRHTTNDTVVNAKNDTAVNAKNDTTNDAVKNNKIQPVKESYIKKFNEFNKID
jgi:hypothetical protein